MQADKSGEITFYDSVTGKPLFIAPRGRTFEDFKKESLSHGWPSFRDEEVSLGILSCQQKLTSFTKVFVIVQVVWENVRCLTDGEAVSVDGTHLVITFPHDKQTALTCYASQRKLTLLLPVLPHPGA